MLLVPSASESPMDDGTIEADFEAALKALGNGPSVMQEATGMPDYSGNLTRLR